MKIKYLVYYLLLAWAFCSCAKIVTPTGGEQDSTPPKMLKEQPASQSVDFNSPTIKITFDEFFTLNNPQQNVLISPPLQTEPEYLIQNKTLVVKFKEDLRPNTTYNILFSNCIQDYHESNKLESYQYSFSTGSYIDTFMLPGIVLDAQTLSPAADMYVMLYDEDVDSLPRHSLATYVTRTQSNGQFKFRNIREGQYKVFALRDINSNLLYDLPNEEIAFSEQLVAASVMTKQDTLRKDSLSIADSLTTPKSDAPMLVLHSFVVPDTIPVLQHLENPAAGIYHFPYKSAIADFSATPLSRDAGYFQSISATADTVTWYFKELFKDTLQYELVADNHIDTVKLIPFKEKTSQRTPRGSKPLDKSRLSVTAFNQGELHKPMTLRFSYPVMPTDSFDILLCKRQKNTNDTLFYRINVPDTFVLNLPLSIKFEPNQSYTLIIPDSVFHGYNNMYNDSVKIDFNTKSEKDYGSLIMHYELVGQTGPFIAQLWNDKKLIQEDILLTDKEIIYPYLESGSYKICLIRDTNGNNRWDAGNYDKHLQPESVFYYKAMISIRANWESEETFNLENDLSSPKADKAGRR